MINVSKLQSLMTSNVALRAIVGSTFITLNIQKFALPPALSKQRAINFLTTLYFNQLTL